MKRAAKHCHQCQLSSLRQLALLAEQLVRQDWLAEQELVLGLASGLVLVELVGSVGSVE